MKINHDEIASLIREAAQRFILPRWKKLDTREVSKKADDDLVTIADREAETFLSVQLSRLLPGSIVIGEESAHENPQVLNALYSEAAVWVIDPLDGTGNFAAGDDRFAVMVCLISGGETLAAWIYDPIRQTLVSAEKSAGAFTDGQALRLSAGQLPTSAMSGALLTRFLPDALRPTARAAASRFGHVMMSRCGGYDYQAFAHAQLQFLFYYRTLVWDHAPGSLIAEEAGGLVRRLDGSAYDPRDTKSGLLVADCSENWLVVQQAVVPSITAKL